MIQKSNKPTVTVETRVNQSVQMVWELWTTPEDVMNWNFASPEWHCPVAENDLKPGGRFKYRMEAKDGSMGFDFAGRFTQVVPGDMLEFVLDDGRKVSIQFTANEGTTTLVETFEAEDQNSIELQRQGWQAILNNFKQYAESQQ